MANELVLNKILIIKGILAEKCGLHPDLYEELSDLLDDIRILNDAKDSALAELSDDICELNKHVTNCKFTAETQWLKKLLPERYNCEPREHGVHCYDTTGKGICDDHMAHEKYDPETDNQWGLIVKAIEQKFGKKLMEIYGQEPQTWSKFTVFLRPE